MIDWKKVSLSENLGVSIDTQIPTDPLATDLQDCVLRIWVNAMRTPDGQLIGVGLASRELH